MAKLQLIIGNKNYSSWSLRAWGFLTYHNIKFIEKKVLLSTQSTKDELRPFNSDFKVPILIDNDFVIWDSLAILEYVSEKYLNSSGWPMDEKVRAFARSVSAEMHSSFPNIRSSMPMNCRRKFKNFIIPSKAKREVARVEYLWERCRKQFGNDGPFLFGNYSIADAMYAPVVLRFSSYGVKLNKEAEQYVQLVLQQNHIKQWITDATNETEIIEEEEI